jgi:hypothetical protein
MTYTAAVERGGGRRSAGIVLGGRQEHCGKGYVEGGGKEGSLSVGGGLEEVFEMEEKEEGGEEKEKGGEALSHTHMHTPVVSVKSVVSVESVEGSSIHVHTGSPPRRKSHAISPFREPTSCAKMSASRDRNLPFQSNQVDGDRDLSCAGNESRSLSRPRSRSRSRSRSMVAPTLTNEVGDRDSPLRAFSPSSLAHAPVSVSLHIGGGAGGIESF